LFRLSMQNRYFDLHILIDLQNSRETPEQKGLSVKVLWDRIILVVSSMEHYCCLFDED